MPKINMDYSKCEMYKIIPNDDNLDYCYIGHTTNFMKRKCKHKSACNNPKNKSYNFKFMACNIFNELYSIGSINYSNIASFQY